LSKSGDLFNAVFNGPFAFLSWLGRMLVKDERQAQYLDSDSNQRWQNWPRIMCKVDKF
jgi:hypothetical protein